MAYGFSVSFMNSHYGPCRWIPGLHGSFPKLGVPFWGSPYFGKLPHGTFSSCIVAIATSRGSKLLPLALRPLFWDHREPIDYRL